MINKNIQCFLPRQKVIKSRIDSTPLSKYQTKTLRFPGASAFSHRKAKAKRRAERLSVAKENKVKETLEKAQTGGEKEV